MPKAQAQSSKPSTRATPSDDVADEPNSTAPRPRAFAARRKPQKTYERKTVKNILAVEPKKKPRANAKGSKLTRAQRNIEWIEKNCRIPEGKFVGQPVKLRLWQKRIIIKIYDNPDGTRKAIISFGRKNGKTAFCSFLLLLHLVGPEAHPNSQLLSAAQSRDQAALLFGLAAKIVRFSPDLSIYVTVRDAKKELFCPELGTVYRALSAEAKTSFGASPIFLVHDELGQVRGPKSDLYDALETACAAHDNPMSVVISTQAAKDSDLLSILIDDALTGADPTTVIDIWTAPMDADPFDEETVKLANPAFGDFQNAKEVMKIAGDARRMSSQEPSYRNLYLNQRIESVSPFVSRTVWLENAGDPDEYDDQVEIYAGLDLSSVNDLTAFVPIAIKGGLFHVRPKFWLPKEGIVEKSKADRVPYDQWAELGKLILTPGRTISYEWVATQIYKFCQDHNVKKIGFDRWGFKYLRPWLVKAGFPEEIIDEIFVEIGQGYQSMTPALREFEAALLESQLRHGAHPVMNMCASNAKVQEDAAGNRKLDKAKSTGRIDGMVAAAMAFGVMPVKVGKAEAAYQMIIV